MSKRCRITEEQYNSLVKEGVTLTADVAATNGDVNRAIDNTRKEAQKNGVDLNKANIQLPANAGMAEGRLITKQTLIENRLKVLKEHSKLYSLNDFIKR